MKRKHPKKPTKKTNAIASAHKPAAETEVAPPIAQPTESPTAAHPVPVAIVPMPKTPKQKLAHTKNTRLMALIAFVTGGVTTCSTLLVTAMQYDSAKNWVLFVAATMCFLSGGFHAITAPKHPDAKDGDQS